MADEWEPVEADLGPIVPEKPKPRTERWYFVGPDGVGVDASGFLPVEDE